MIYLCGITSSEYNNIKELTDPIWEVVDGLIYVVDDKAGHDGTLELLEDRKGHGEILYRKWTCDHDLSMNVFLRESVLKEDDWFVMRDSMERFNPEWAKKLPEYLQACDLQGFRSLFNYGKGFAFKWNDAMIFSGSPHWGLQGYQHGAKDLMNEFSEDDHEHTWRLRDGEEGGRPIDNKINHEARYAWCYGRSNHLVLGMEREPELWQRAELIRLHTRDSARQMGIPRTLDGLKDFMEVNSKENPEAFAQFINSHRVWKNFWRYHFLNEDFVVIDKTENDWVYEK